MWRFIIYLNQGPPVHYDMFDHRIPPIGRYTYCAEIDFGT
jgi:hypothetical protein